MSIGSFFAGDALVMASSGARGLVPARRPDRYQQVVNIVEEMRLAGGLPPSSALDHRRLRAERLRHRPRSEHASVAVTTGLVDKLDREELQGVIGHEMSHIGNLDIRFTLLVGVLVGSIALLSDWFLRFTYWGGGRRSDSDRGGGGAAAILLVVALVLAVVAPIIGRIVQAAVSRSRESWPTPRPSS